MDSIRPGPLFRCTSIAAPITSLLRRSAFSYNGCIRERFTEGNKGNKGWNWIRNPSAVFLSFCFSFLHPHRRHLSFQISRKTPIEPELELDLEAFVTFVSFCLRFLLVSRIAGDRLDDPDVVFAFHDREEIGPKMLARIAKRTGLTPDDL